MSFEPWDDLDLYASNSEAKNRIQSILEACMNAGIYQIHAMGYDLKLNECELAWKPTSTRSAHILGLEANELPHRWYLVLKRRGIEIDMVTLKSALKKAWLLRETDER